MAAIEHVRQQNRFPDELKEADVALDLGKCYLRAGNLDQAEHFLKIALRQHAFCVDVAQAYIVLSKKRGDLVQIQVWQDRATLAELEE